VKIMHLICRWYQKLFSLGGRCLICQGYWAQMLCSLYFH